MKIKNPVRIFFDWYVRNYHAEDYVHISMIQPEISKRIEKAVKQNNEIRDEQESIKIKSLELKFKIQESGWCAEIENMEKVVKDVQELREGTMNVYYATYQKAKDLALITAENKHEGNNIIKSVAASVGKLDIIGKNTEDLVLEMDKNKNSDEKALGVK